MITQDELIKASTEFGLPLTTQTLRNYIKSGLCHGAVNTESGIQTRGILPVYPPITLAEALTAKALLEVSGRKLDRIQVVFAKFYANEILSKGPRAFLDYEETVALVANNLQHLGYKVEVDVSKNKLIWRKSVSPTMAQILSGHSQSKGKLKEFNLYTITFCAAEWITLFANFCNDDFRKLRLKYPKLNINVILNTVHLPEADEYVGLTKQGCYDFSRNPDDFVTISEKCQNYLQNFNSQSENPGATDDFIVTAKQLPTFITFSFNDIEAKKI